MGWLDGKDPDIPLAGEPEGPKQPEAPQINTPAATTLCLGARDVNGNNSVSYTYSIKDATQKDSVYWVVTAANSTTPLTDVAAINPGSKSQSTTITWKKAGTYWVNAYVRSEYLANSGHSDIANSEYAHVAITVNDRPQAQLSFDKSAYRPTDGRIVATVSDASSLTGTKTYGWLKPRSASGATYTQGSIAAGQSFQFQAYVQAANGCRDTSAIESKIVGDNPKLTVEVEEVYALCAGGVGELWVSRVTTENGDEVALGSCTFAWKNGSTSVSSAANCTVSAAGTYSVTVSGGGAEGTVSRTVTQSSNTAPTLTDKSFYVKTQTSKPVIWVGVNNGSEESLTWNWSPAANLSSATVARPTVTSGLSTAASGTDFTVYAVDEGTKCRSANAKANVRVNSTNGLDVTIDPGEAVTLCRGNHRYLTAKVNGTLGTALSGYTYEWTPGTYLSATSGPQVVFNATTAGTYEVFVTATKGSYSSTQKITVTVKSDEAPTIQKNTSADWLACTGSQLEVIVTPLAPTGSTNYYTYAWTNDGKTIGGNTNPFTFEADGEYDMSLKVTAPNGCEADTVNWPHLSVRTAPQDLALSLSGSFGTGGTVLCGESGTLTLSYAGNTKPEVIKWYRNGVEVTTAQNQTTLAVTNRDASSTYKVVASNGVCEATTTDFSFTSTSLPASLAINVVESCGELVLSATPVDGFNNWEWSAGSGLEAVGETTASTVRYSGSSYGNYAVTLTAKNGQQCYKTVTETVALKQKPEVQWAANNPTNQCEGDVLRVTADMDIKSYVWKNGTITAASTTSGYALPLNGGTIMAIVTAENGCADTVSGSFAGHSKPDLVWNVEPASKYYAGETIKASVKATKGDGQYHYYYTSPYTLDNTTGDGQDYMANIRGTNDFFVMVADNHGCRDTLRKAVAVEGQDLVVDIEVKHNVVFCSGGSAILTAKVQHGVGALTYQWYKNSSPISGATDSVYVVERFGSSPALESYRVEVKCPATEGTGDATKTWSGAPGSAAQLTVLADVITILPGEVALLGAEVWSPNSTSLTYNWHWSDAKNFSDVSKLAVGEDTKQFPHTTALKGNAAYKVYAIDNNGCMTNIGDVQVNIDPDEGLRVDVDPLRSELCRNNSVELKANANLTIDATEWYPTEFGNDGVTLKANGTGSVVFAAGNNSVPKDYQVVVKVKSGNSYALALATVTVKSERAPKLPEINDGCGGKTIYIQNVEGVNDDGFVWYVDGELLVDNHSWSQEFDNNDHVVKVVMKSSDCDCWSDTLRFNVWQSPVIEGEMIVDKTTVQVNDKANLEVTLSEATSNYAGMTGVWSTTPAGFEGTASGKHDRLMTTGALTEENTTVTYTISNKKNAKCSATKSAHLTVFDPNTGFKLSLSDKVLAKCEGDPIQVTVTPINANGVEVNYELTGTKNGNPFEKLESTRNGVIGAWTTDYTDLEAGTYQLFIAATETQKGSIARDTLTFTVYPNPTVSMRTLASTALCTGSGDSLAVVLTLGNGSPWTLEYRDGGVAQNAIKDITTTDYTVYLKKSGGFSVMSVTNTHGCKIVNTANTLPSATITDLTPNITLDENGFVSFCQGGESAKVTINLSGGTPDWKVYYRLSDDGKQYTASANASPYELALTEGGKLKVDSVVNLEGCRAEITSGRFFDGVDVPDDRLKVEFLTSEPESICSDGNVGATIALNITPEPRADQWNLAVNCMIHMEDGTDRQLDVEIKPTDKDKDGHYLLKNIVHRGTYLLTSITDGGGCKGSIGDNDTKVMQVGTLPEVHIDSTDFVAFKGDEFVLNAVDKQDGFTYSWSLNDGDAVEDNGGVRGTMEDEDMMYRLIARDPGGCVAEDTVTVYRLPDAPDVNIEKVDSVTLKIVWEHNGRKTNGYRVWHNEWDAYAMESDYTEWGDSYGSTAAPEAVLKVTEQDTLEFFYVVAFREIDLKDGQGRRRFISLPSDTVGYHQQFLRYDDNGSINFISYGFDMSEVMGGNMASQFVSKVIGPRNVWNFAYCLFEKQTWTGAYSYDGWEETYDDFELQVGASYQVTIEESRSFLCYGKLPPKVSYVFEIGDMGSQSAVLLPLHHSNIHSIVELMQELMLEEFGMESTAVNYWDFVNQVFAMAFWDGIEVQFDMPIRPLTPLLIEPLLEMIKWE